MAIVSKVAHDLMRIHDCLEIHIQSGYCKIIIINVYSYKYFL